MRYRFAKRTDIDRIVYLHHKVRQVYDVGFFSKVDKTFLKQYYKTILDDPNEIVLCAEDNNGIIQGFCSGNLNVSKQKLLLIKNKWKLGIALIPSIMVKPNLILESLNRFRSINQNQSKNKQYIVEDGVRSEYWTWNDNAKDSESSTDLLNRFYHIIYILGYNEVYFEVDLINQHIFKFHLYNGAELIEKILLSDGRERAILKYNLITKFKNK
jgi:hypothetical protein